MMYGCVASDLSLTIKSLGIIKTGIINVQIMTSVLTMKKSIRCERGFMHLLNIIIDFL